MSENIGEEFAIGSVRVNGVIFLNIDDLLMWLKDCQKNGMDHETIQWLIKSIIICKNGVKQDLNKKA